MCSKKGYQHWEKEMINTVLVSASFLNLQGWWEKKNGIAQGTKTGRGDNDGWDLRQPSWKMERADRTVSPLWGQGPQPKTQGEAIWGCQNTWEGSNDRSAHSEQLASCLSHLWGTQWFILQENNLWGPVEGRWRRPVPGPSEKSGQDREASGCSHAQPRAVATQTSGRRCGCHSWDTG